MDSINLQFSHEQRGESRDVADGDQVASDVSVNHVRLSEPLRQDSVHLTKEQQRALKLQRLNNNAVGDAMTASGQRHCTFWTGLFLNPPRTVNPVGAGVFSVVSFSVTFPACASSSSPPVTSCSSLPVAGVSGEPLTGLAEIQRPINQSCETYFGLMFITETTSQ